MVWCHKRTMAQINKGTTRSIINEPWKCPTSLINLYTLIPTSKAGPYLFYTIMSPPLPTRSDFLADNGGLVAYHTGECVICKEEEAAEPVTTCQCKNVYCRDCITSWLKDNSTCPCCRRILLVDDNSEYDRMDLDEDMDDDYHSRPDPFDPSLFFHGMRTTHQLLLRLQKLLHSLHRTSSSPASPFQSRISSETTQSLKTRMMTFLSSLRLSRG